MAEARRELARAIGRRGDFDAALTLLAEARAIQVSHNQPGEILTTDARTAEVLVMAGRTTDALALAEEAIARVGGTDGGSILVPALRRVEGWSLLQHDDPSGARPAFAEALDLARARDDEYQAGQAIAGLIAIEHVEGRDGAALELELQTIKDRLGIVAIPTIPTTETREIAPERPDQT